MVILWGVSLSLGFLVLLSGRKSNCMFTKSANSLLPKVVNLFMLMSLLILMCANRMGYDAKNFITYYSYVSQYSNNPWDYTYQVFFYIVNWYTSIFKTSSYYEFHAAVLAVTGIVILVRNSKYIMNLTIVLFLYLASGVYAADGMQIKNFIAVCILITAISYLVQTGRKNYMTGIVLLFAASLVHFSFAVYFSFLVVHKIPFQKIKSIFPMIGSICYCVLFLGGRALTNRLLSVLALIPGMSKLQGYGDVFAGKRSLVVVFIYFMILLVLCIGKNWKGNLSYYAKQYVETVLDMFLLLGITLPLSIYANAVYRLYRNMYIPVFIVIGNYIVSMPRFSINRLAYTIMVLVAVILLFSYPYILRQADDIYVSVFKGSYFWME